MPATVLTLKMRSQIVARKLSVVTMTLMVLCMSSQAFAQDANNEFTLLRQQLQALSERLDSLEASNHELRQENARLKSASENAEQAARQTGEQIAAMEKQLEQAGSASWTDRIALKGDFRLRYENIDQQNRDERNRSRVRARAAIVASITDDVEVGLGMASGGDDPLSTNQTLGGGGSTKGLNLDLAYFEWTGLDNAAIVGGKFKNFLYKPGKTQLQWDGDWNPEGIGVAFATDGLFVNAMGNWLETDSKNKSKFSYILQAGISRDLSDDTSLTAGLGYSRANTQGFSTFYGDSDDFFGNSFDPVTNTYLYDYHVVELFASLGFKLAGHAASIWVNAIENQDAPTENSGFAAGFSIGSAKSAGDWAFGYAYVDREADATLGQITDSDFGGGGTDNNGHILSYSYAIEKNWNAALTYLINESGHSTGTVNDYDRLQADLVFKY
jgi:cell division protein FtsB